MKIIEQHFKTVKGEDAFLIQEAHTLTEFISKVRSAIEDGCDVLIYRGEYDLMNDNELTLESVIEIDNIDEIGTVVVFDRILSKS